MVRVHAVAALVVLLAAACRRGDGASVSRGEIGDTLIDVLDIRTSVSENRTADFRIPEYMYRLYRDAGNHRRTQPLYDCIRSISPETESHGDRTTLVYDLSPLESTETVQKAVLRLESGDANGVNVTLFSAAENDVSETCLGSARVDGGSLDLAVALGPQSVNGLRRLTVRVDGNRNNASAPSTMGLVLYSKNAAAAAAAAAGGPAKGHELAELLFESATRAKRRSRRSVIDNEVDAKKANHFAAAESKRKRRKKKGSRVNKLQAVDAGDTIAFVDPDQCRMEKLVLNFADIGWEDWVIYPKGFETNYCAGGCLFPLGKGLRPTNHATVQSLARSFGRLWDVPEPSCVPDTLAPLTLLYMDRSNHVLLKSYPDMRVITCSCK